MMITMNGEGALVSNAAVRSGCAFCSEQDGVSQ